MTHPLSGGLPIEADLMLAEAPPPPFDWVREGTSYWLFEENGKFGIPRNGVEAEPFSWESRRYQANFAFADGRLLLEAWRSADGQRLPLPAEPAIAAGDRAEVNAAIDAWLDELRAFAALGADYGRSGMGGGSTVNTEYVSANATGPMHMGHCRGAVVGDALATLLEFAGHKVIRE